MKVGWLGLCRDADRAAAGCRVRPGRLPGRPHWVAAHAARLRRMDALQRSRTIPHERRGAGQLHAVLAHEHRHLGWTTVLGEPRTSADRCGRAEDGRDRAPGGHHGRSGGGLSRPGVTGPRRLSQPRLLSRGRQGWLLRGLGAAAALSVRAARSIPIAGDGERHMGTVTCPMRHHRDRHHPDSVRGCHRWERERCSP
jgi:hypothetical protein